MCWPLRIRTSLCKTIARFTALPITRTTTMTSMEREVLEKSPKECHHFLVNEIKNNEEEIETLGQPPHRGPRASHHADRTEGGGRRTSLRSRTHSCPSKRWPLPRRQRLCSEPWVAKAADAESSAKKRRLIVRPRAPLEASVAESGWQFQAQLKSSVN